MQLIGSVTSPFARRTRILLHKVEHEFVSLDIFSAEGHAELGEKNPAKKIPILKDEGHTIYDSRVIFNYLSEKLQLEKLTWHQQNLLTMIDAANDSLVSLFLSMKSDLPVNEERLFFQLQHGRVDAVLVALNNAVINDDFSDWAYPEICLFCLLDWITFRELVQWQHHEGLVSFYQKAQLRDDCKQTDPR